ncbi:MAG: hypothetical protein LWX01_06030 [Deltaproteobacteria bacterium]|nr:hypothetical protein [Deltaproteobacteria bacterium]MDL1961245.1 hypothetical protein [Deltaproteobacteria bacterium]
MCVERIKDLKTKMRLNAPNAFLADKLLTAIYGAKKAESKNRGLTRLAPACQCQIQSRMGYSDLYTMA